VRFINSVNVLMLRYRFDRHVITAVQPTQWCSVWLNYSTAPTIKLTLMWVYQP